MRKKSTKYTDKEINEICINNGYKKLEQYSNNRTPFLVKCLTCNTQCKKYLNSIQKKTLCPVCKNKKISENSKKSDINVDTICKQFNFERLGDYKGIYKPMKVKCLKCNTIHNKTLARIQNRNICKFCFYIKNSGKNHSNWNPEKELLETLRSKCSVFQHLYKKLFSIKNYNINYLIKKLKCNKIDILNFKEKYKHWKNIRFDVDHIFPLYAWINEGFIKTKKDITDKILLEINCLNNIQLLEPSKNYSKGCKYDKYKFYDYILQKEINKWQQNH